MEKVIVYGTPDCPYCSQIREYLTRKGVDFVYYDVSEDRARAREAVAKSRQGGVPVTEINGRIIVGFDRAAIDKALTMKKVDPALMRQNLTFDLLER